MTARKGRPTPKQVTALRRQRGHGEGVRGWLQGLLSKRESAADDSPPSERHGVTRRMRNIRRPGPVFVHRHEDVASGWWRRHFRTQTGEIANLTPARRPAHTQRSRPDYRPPAVNVPYVNPARVGVTGGTDRERRIARKRAARLRRELR